MNNRMITRERGVIPGCRAAGPDSHMAVDGLGRPWLEVAKLPSTIDAWLAALREETRRSAPISLRSSGWKPYGSGASDSPARERSGRQRSKPTEWLRSPHWAELP